MAGVAVFQLPLFTAGSFNLTNTPPIYSLLPQTSFLRNSTQLLTSFPLLLFTASTAHLSTSTAIVQVLSTDIVLLLATGFPLKSPVVTPTSGSDVVFKSTVLDRWSEGRARFLLGSFDTNFFLH